MVTFYYIYKAFCKNTNKCYIGWTTNLVQRKRNHLKWSKLSQYKFSKAIRKYGWESFIWTVIDQGLDGQYVKNVLEPKYIEQYDSFYHGYNSTKGGDGVIGYHHTEENKKKISKPGCLHPMFGKPGSMLGKRNPNAGLSAKGNKYCLGRKCPPDEILKRTNSIAKNWLITPPNGVSFIIKNLKQFCRENNLGSSNMVQVSKLHQKGVIKYHKGWLCEKLQIS